METKTNNIIKKAEENLIHTYNRADLVLDHGDGVYLYDVEGNKYLDFAAGIAVYALGYNYKDYNNYHSYFHTYHLSYTFSNIPFIYYIL